MTTDIDHKVDGTTAAADGIDAEPKDEFPRGKRTGGKAIVAALALAAAGGAIILTALGGAGLSRAACEEKVNAHVASVLRGNEVAAANPVTCSGISQAEVDQISGTMFARAVAG